MSRLGAQRSGWNAADIRGEAAERLIAAPRWSLRPQRGWNWLKTSPRAIAACVALLEQAGMPEHIRALTSRQVLKVETDITERLAARRPLDPHRQRAASLGRLELR